VRRPIDRRSVLPRSLSPRRPKIFEHGRILTRVERRLQVGISHASIDNARAVAINRLPAFCLAGRRAAIGVRVNCERLPDPSIAISRMFNGE
jgi:hypothetical protein